MPDDRAFHLEADVLDKLAAARHQWVPLAASLHAFHAERGWTDRGCESFQEWLAQPEVGMSYRSAKDMIDAYGCLCIARGISAAELAEVDPSKIAVVLPALRAGRVDAARALADCRALARNDLRERYRGGDDALDAGSEPVRHACPDCGRMHLLLKGAA